MYSHIREDLPLVVICNISETFYPFLSRAQSENERTRLVKGEQYRGDRALIWLTNAKLVYMSFAVQHDHYLADCLGYTETRHLVPDQASAALSLDILREPRLLQGLIDYAGSDRTLQIVPYATTPEFYQLVDVLREQHGLTILLPETSSYNAAWVRDYIDTKAGFRALASRWLPNAPDLIPIGFSCQNTDLAAQVAHWFCVNNKASIIKADTGENGIGNIVHPGNAMSVEAIKKRIESNPFLQGDWLTVEEYIPSADGYSPSLEILVPPAEVGKPEVTYLSRQLFLGFGDFCGVLVSKELQAETWYQTLLEAGLRIADHMQQLGYIGHFDLDAVVGDDGNVYLVEINTRRTGGTHTHEFARFVFGDDYLQRIALLSHDAMESGGIADMTTLTSVIGDLLYSVENETERGVIITGTSAMEAQEFGCIVVGKDTSEVIEIQQQLRERVHQYAAQGITASAS